MSPFVGGYTANAEIAVYKPHPHPLRIYRKDSAKRPFAAFGFVFLCLIFAPGTQAGNYRPAPWEPTTKRRGLTDRKPAGVES